MLRHETSVRQAAARHAWCASACGDPSRDAAQIGLLLRERLQRTALPAPVYALALRLDEAVGHAGREAALWRDAQRAGDDDSRSRAVRPPGRAPGPRARAAACGCSADHRPERAMAAAPAQCDGASAQSIGLPRPHAPRPAWLLPEPLRLQETRPAARCTAARSLLRSRAERIEAGWFDGDWSAAITTSPKGATTGCAGSFASGAGTQAQWYLHGLFG